MTSDETMATFGKRAAAWCAIAAIGILSLLPADEVAPIRTSLGGHLEHVVAYAVTALITAIAYVYHSRFKITFSLILYAAVLEYLQRFSPGRSSSFVDLMFSSTGVMLGIATFQVLRHLPEGPPNR
jgi:VanZ family protein